MFGRIINVLQKYKQGEEFVLLPYMRSKSYNILLMCGLVFMGSVMQATGQYKPAFNRCFYGPIQPPATKISYDSIWAVAQHQGFYLRTPSLNASVRKQAPVISPAWHMATWGLFCHIEHRFRQTTKVPLYLRLGSLAHTNRLEGK